MWMAVGIPATAKAPGLISAVSTGMNNIVQTSPQNVGEESAKTQYPTNWRHSRQGSQLLVPC